jgi:hypothetical protein
MDFELKFIFTIVTTIFVDPLNLLWGRELLKKNKLCCCQDFLEMKGKNGDQEFQK